MKTKIIVGVIVLALAIIGLVAANLGTTESQENTEVEEPTCGGSCSGNQNCGLSSCGATSGRSCGCGK